MIPRYLRRWRMCPMENTKFSLFDRANLPDLIGMNTP
jgi:hypothetical protein